MGVVSNKILSRFDINQPLYYAELDWHALVAISMKKKVLYTPLPKSMAVKRDLALLLDKAVTFDRVEAVIRDSERRLLREVTLFDV